MSSVCFMRKLLSLIHEPQAERFPAWAVHKSILTFIIVSNSPPLFLWEWFRKLLTEKFVLLMKKALGSSKVLQKGQQISSFISFQAWMLEWKTSWIKLWKWNITCKAGRFYIMHSIQVELKIENNVCVNSSI